MRIKCKACDGWGYIETRYFSWKEREVVRELCKECGGKGWKNV